MMQPFREFIKQNAGTLSIFDLDYTLFRTTANLVIKKDGKVVREITSTEYNSHTLGPGEEYGFDQFRSAAVLHASTPITNMVNKIRAIQRHVRKTPLSRTIIVTARADLDDKKEVVAFFKKHKIDVDNEIYIERSGNLQTGSTADKKKVIFERYLSTGVYKRVVLYDDHVGNLKALLDLKPKYPHIKLEAFLVDGSTGEVSSYRG